MHTLLSLALAAAPLPQSDAAAEPAASPGHWQVEIVLQAPTKLGACAVGDVDPRHPGPEIVAVASTGEVWVAHRAEGGWRSEVVWKAPGEMIQVAVGDADPRHPGDEIVCVGIAAGGEDDGGPGAAHLVRRTEDGWAGSELFRDTALLHAVAVGEAGVFVAGYGERLVHLAPPAGEGDAWRSTDVAQLAGAAKCAAATPDGCVVAVTDGTVLQAGRVGEAWTTKVLDRRDAARARLSVGGRMVAVGDDDGALSLVGPVGPAESKMAAMRVGVHREGQKLRGAVVGDLDPDHEGDEIASAGYEGVVRLHRRAGEGWTTLDLFRDLDRFHHLTAADLDGKPGLELVVCGYTGRVVIVRKAAGL